MIRRLLAGIFVIWFLGFLWFAVFLPVPLEGGKTDAIVVPTGSGGRIEHGLEVLRAGRAKEMLVTGVDREVKPAEFAAEYKVGERMMECCVSLGFAGGALSCDANCNLDDSQCSLCGNGMVDPGEQCDGGDFAGD